MYHSKIQSDETLHAFEVTEFINEIDKVFPTITCPVKRQAVSRIRDFIFATSSTTLPGPGESPDCSPIDSITLTIVVELLRRCGIAPAGWPQPDAEEATPDAGGEAPEGKGGAQ
jgi:hypothetical protein